MGIRSEWMKVQMTELESALQNLWSDGLYKIILSNAIKKESEGAVYRKVVLNRKTNGWQAAIYGEAGISRKSESQSGETICGTGAGTGISSVQRLGWRVGAYDPHF